MASLFAGSPVAEIDEGTSILGNVVTVPDCDQHALLLPARGWAVGEAAAICQPIDFSAAILHWREYLLRSRGCTGFAAAVEVTAAHAQLSKKDRAIFLFTGRESIRISWSHRDARFVRLSKTSTLLRKHLLSRSLERKRSKILTRIVSPPRG